MTLKMTMFALKIKSKHSIKHLMCSYCNQLRQIGKSQGKLAEFLVNVISDQGEMEKKKPLFLMQV